MAREIIETMLVNCDICNADMTNQKYGTFLSNLQFTHSEIYMNESGGAGVGYMDVCAHCSSKILKVIKDLKENGVKNEE